MAGRWPFGGNPVDRHVELLEREILGWIGSIWDLPSVRTTTPYPWRILVDPDDPDKEPLMASLRRLEDRWPGEELGGLVADMYFHPAGWRNRYEPGERRGWVLEKILGACLQRHPPADIYPRLEARMEKILRHPCDFPEVPPIELQLSRSYPPRLYRVSTLDECLGLLSALPDSPENVSLTGRVIMGFLDFGPLDLSGFYRHMQIVERSYKIHSDSLQPHFPALMERLYHHGQLGYEGFQKCVRHLPDVLWEASRAQYENGRPSHFHATVGGEFSRTILGYCDRLAQESAEALSEEDCLMLKQIGLQGSRYLLAAARHHSSLGLGKLRLREGSHGVDTGILHLAQAEDVEPATPEQRQELVRQLQVLPAPTLKYLLPVATHGRRILCEALDWSSAWPLVAAVLGAARLDQAPWTGHDIANSADPTEGVLAVAATREALALAGNKRAQEVLRLFRQAKVNAGHAIKLVEAVAGWNRKAIERDLAKRHQIAIKAYGLLPLERGEEETLERYVELQRIQAESKHMGAMRGPNVQAAVQVARANLAQTAGFADATRLEWAMEARIATGQTAVGCRWLAYGYEVDLVLQELKPRLIVRRGEQTLKSVPTGLRETAVYPEIREAVSGLRSQVARFRASLEEIMAMGEAIERDDLAGLARLPVARALLSRLLLCNPDGRVGLWEPDCMGLRGLDGMDSPIPSRATIAHPFHLFRNGELSGWQREIVRQRLVQPFKQVFRELYLVTPAEEDAESFSNRFAGHVLSSHVAARLFEARGWRFETHGDIGLPYKLFPRASLKAYFDFSDLGHFIAENETITSDQIYFVPFSPASRREGVLKEARAPISAIPPLIFSEVMRDADLVVSVAQRETDGWLSGETYQRRTDLVRELMTDLQIHWVTLEGHFAHVQGKLARYRVHLGSAAIHIEPGNYLCVVPDRWGQRHDRLFLPFPDEGSTKFAEVISKILLLANDDRITDESILRQIRLGGLAPR